MTQVAIFVDAGYLFATGGVAVVGRTVKRSEMALDVEAAVNALRSIAEKTAPNSPLLRIYWYDGSIAGGRPTSDQSLVANTNDVKLRLGHVNSKGEQKEVDSFIVTDLIELARLKSISDAVILAGDGDLRLAICYREVVCFADEGIRSGANCSVLERGGIVDCLRTSTANCCARALALWAGNSTKKIGATCVRHAERPFGRVVLQNDETASLRPTESSNLRFRTWAR